MGVGTSDVLSRDPLRLKNLPRLGPTMTTSCRGLTSNKWTTATLKALGKAEHKMGNPCYLCKKFGHLVGVHFPTNHRWCQAESDRWTSNRDYLHKILRDVRE